MGIAAEQKLGELLMTPVGIDSLINSLREYKDKKFNKKRNKVKVNNEVIVKTVIMLLFVFELVGYSRDRIPYIYFYFYVR